MSKARDAFEATIYRCLQRLPTESASTIGSIITQTNIKLFLKGVIAGTTRNLRLHHPDWSDARSTRRFAGTWRMSGASTANMPSCIASRRKAG